MKEYGMLMAIRAFCVCVLIDGCSHLNNITLSNEEIKTLIAESEMHTVEELPREIAIFDNVAFGLGLPLRRYLNDNKKIKGKMILDLGTGSGVLSLIALQNGAKKAVATEINPYAVANAAYNAERFGFKDKMEVRHVSIHNQGAYSVIKNDEKFDLILSNPPQNPIMPKTIYDYSFANPNLEFLKSILEGLKRHLSPNGKGVFALYPQSLNLAYQIARVHGLVVTIYLETKNRNGIYYIVEVKQQQG